MQLVRNAAMFASLFAVAPATVVDSRAAGEEEHHPRKKKNGRHESKFASGRPSLRRAESGGSEWESRKGMLHLEAAEVETEAASDIQKTEDLNTREEHQELATRNGAEKAQVEAVAARDWEAVAHAAEAEALELTQDVAEEGSAAAPGAVPGPAPGPAPIDYSWAHHMVATKPLPEQGLEGEHVLHTDMDTMTADWQSEHALNPEAELCKVCARHPNNAWCRGKKCQASGSQAVAAADAPADDAGDAGEPPAPSAPRGSNPQPSAPSGGGSPVAVENSAKKEQSGGGLFGGLFGADDPIFGKDGLLAGIKDIFGSGAAARGALAALLPVALMLASQ